MNGRTITALQMRDLAMTLLGPIKRPCTFNVSGGRREVRVFLTGTDITILQLSRAQLLLTARCRGLVC